ncbi:MAG: hypothetical protein ACXW5U_10965 [Thermoanaerobaculia bacterium]
MLAALVLALRTFARRVAATRAAHEARLAAMAQVHLAAARKKKAAAAPAQEPTVTPASAAPVRDERECPFCAELILKKARVCKHCGRDVPVLA